ncbi:helix-turn-helix domain-containing protein, partial [Empedobacter falsenii]
MKKIYKQLDQEQRYQIGILLTAGKSKKDIADLIGVHKSTITRELQRNIGKRGLHYTAPKKLDTFGGIFYDKKSKIWCSI